MCMIINLSRMRFSIDKTVADMLFRGLLVLAALVFSISYAFGQYIRYKENNINDLNAWINCAQTDQLSDKAYEFCKTKASENYIFKTPFDWGEGGDD